MPKPDVMPVECIYDHDLERHDLERIVDTLHPEDILAALQEQIGDPRLQYDICIRFVGLEEGRVLNAQYRHKDYPTNVLSFPNTVKPPFAEAAAGLLGDIAICWPVVEEEAQMQSKSTRAHATHLIVHGILHLLGFDHAEEEQASVMEAHEVRILSALEFPDPYA